MLVKKSIPGQRSQSAQRNQKRRGVVLLAVLVVVAFLALAAYRFNDSMSAEFQATDSAVRLVQARAIADSGVAYAISELSQGNMPQAGVVQSVSMPNSTNNGTFEILSFEDESSKWNINALLSMDPTGKQLSTLLTKLQPQVPSLTPDVIASIVDWLDSDDTPGEGGCENEYYNTQDPPYYCKNGPLDSIDELLLVKGITPEILFGDGLNPGIASYFTIFSREQNVIPPTSTSSGSQAFTAKINLNDTDVQSFKSKASGILSDNLTTFLMAYRIYGASKQQPNTLSVVANLLAGKGSTEGVAGMKSEDYSAISAEITKKLEAAASDPSILKNKITSIMDLVSSNIDVTVKTEAKGNQPASTKTITFPSPLKDTSAAQQYLPTLFQDFTTADTVDLPAKINILSADQIALQGLPSLEAADIQMIVSNRPAGTQQTDPVYLTPTWLLTTANLTAQKIKGIENYVTGRSTAFRVRVLGKLDKGGPMGLMEAVIETSGPRPRVVYFRDLSEKSRQAKEAGGDPVKLAGF